MDKKKALGVIAGATVATTIATRIMKNKAKETTYTAELMEPIEQRQMGFYEKYVKRGLDVACASAALICFSPLYFGVAALVKIKLGSPILFTQDRPGLIGEDGKETIFKMYKFRTMTDERDENGNLLTDEQRLTKFGARLRSTSLDELPEAFNILNGTMSVVGPRPQLVRDMVFMDEGQRQRHTAKPGLSGLAQTKGRNAISWDEKISWDLKYINKINVRTDCHIVVDTLKKAFIKREGITENDNATASDYGDVLLKNNRISLETYTNSQEKAKKILSEDDGVVRNKGLVSIIMPSYNTADYIEDSINSVLNQTYTNWELLIVDDCSSDDTMKIISKFDDDRIKVFQNPINSGAAISRNIGIKEARGQWIAFLDSDDLWVPQKLEEQIHFMEYNSYAFSFTSYEEIDENSRPLGIRITGPKRVTKQGMNNYCYPGCLTVIYDAQKIGLIQIKDIKKNNDYAMWLKVCEKADCWFLNKCLAKYRKRKGSISRHSIKTMIGWHYKLWHEVEGKNQAVSLIYTARNILFGTIKKIKYVKEV